MNKSVTGLSAFHTLRCVSFGCRYKSYKAWTRTRFYPEHL